MATIPLKDITFPGLDNTYTIPEIDNTLSTVGKAADAKKTGDEIESLKSTAAAQKDDMLKAFPTDSAQGAVASFSDGAEIPVKSLVVNIDPVQDLHGQDAPYPAGGGKNLCPEKSYVSGSNMYFGGETQDTRILTLSAGTYTFSVIPSDGNPVALYFMDSTNANAYASTGSGTSVTATFEAETEVVLKAYSSRFSSGLSITKFQLEKGSTATDYAPYSNICPISGWDAVQVIGTGKNVIRATDISDISNWTSLGSSSFALPLDLKKGFTYTLSGEHTVAEGVSPYVYLQKYVDGAWTSESQFWQNMKNSLPYTFTASTDEYRLWAYGRQSSIENIDWLQLELGSTATPYEPYKGESVTIDLGQTVYGGKFDVLSGEVKVEVVMDTFDLSGRQYTTTNGFDSWTLNLTHTSTGASDRANKICDCAGYNYATSSLGTSHFYASTTVAVVYLPEGAHRSDTITIAYPLATPTTFSLTPHEVHSLLGDNNIWADSGDSAVEYRADPTLYIQRLTEPDADMVADANITSGSYFMVGNTLYKATANIASGATISPNVNCTRKSLSEALNEINA